MSEYSNLRPGWICHKSAFFAGKLNNGLGPNKRQNITGTDDDTFHWLIHASPGHSDINVMRPDQAQLLMMTLFLRRVSAGNWLRHVYWAHWNPDGTKPLPGPIMLIYHQRDLVIYPLAICKININSVWKVHVCNHNHIPLSNELKIYSTVCSNVSKKSSLLIQYQWIMSLTVRGSFDHDDVVICKRFLHYWSFVRVIYQWPADYPHKEPVLWSFSLYFCQSEQADELTVELSVNWDPMVSLWRHYTLQM